MIPLLRKKKQSLLLRVLTSDNNTKNDWSTLRMKKRKEEKKRAIGARGHGQAHRSNRGSLRKHENKESLRVIKKKSERTLYVAVGRTFTAPATSSTILSVSGAPKSHKIWLKFNVNSPRASPTS